MNTRAPGQFSPQGPAHTPMTPQPGHHHEVKGTPMEETPDREGRPRAVRGSAPQVRDGAHRPAAHPSPDPVPRAGGTPLAGLFASLAASFGRRASGHRSASPLRHTRSRTGRMVAVSTGVALVAAGVGLGAPPAQAEPTVPEDPMVVAHDGDVTYRFVPAGVGEGHVFEVERDGVPQWATSSGAVSVNVQGNPAAYFPYSEVSVEGDKRVASASVTVGSGTVVEVRDTYSFDQGTLDIDRSFEVTDLAAADAGKGVSVSYPLADATKTPTGSYKWFSPGTWYGNDALTFTDRNAMAFDGKETALSVDGMTAPLITAWNPSTTWALTLLDRTPGQRETVAADKDPQTGKTIVDSRLNLPGLGLRTQSGGSKSGELFQSYPGDTKNYRNRYGSKPTVWRMLPLSQGLSRQTGMALRYSTADSFQEMVSSVWRKAFADTATVVDRVDTKLHFDTIVDYIFNSYGTTADGKRIYSSNYELLQTSSGFLWRQADLASIQLAQGWQRGDEEMAQRARNVVDDQISKGGLVSSNPRTHAESMTAVLNAYLTDKAHGRENPTWLATVRAYADALPATPTIWAVPVLLELAKETGEARYRQTAVAAGGAALDTQSQDMLFAGSLEDYAGGPSERDREMGLTSLEAYMALYRDARSEGEKTKWLAAAKLAADYSETWNYIQDLSTTPEDGTADLVMYGNDHVRPYGISQIHAGAAGGDVAAAFFVTEFYELWEATGDQHYRDFAVFLEKNSMLYTNMGDKYGQMADSVKGSGLGFTNEYLGTAANDYWNNNQRGDGNRSNIGWATYMMAGMTQKTLDRLGRYTVAEPTVSDINGLNAYYRLVNRATGQALDVEDGFRGDNAPLNTTQVDPTTAVSTQHWLLEPLGTAGDGGLKLVNRSTAKALRPQSDSTQVGARAVGSVPMPGQHLGYALAAQTDGSYVVTNIGSATVLELNDTDATKPVVQHNRATGSDYQKWYLQPVGDLQILDSGASRVLAVDDAGEVSRQDFDEDATLPQRWSAVPSLDGYVGLVSRGSGLALTAQGGAAKVMAASAPDVQGFSPDQQWLVDIRPDGYATLTSRTGRSLQVQGDHGVTLVDGGSPGSEEVADAALLRVTTAGPATVNRAVSAVVTDAVALTVVQGGRAELPGSVTVHHSDGSVTTAQATWDLTGLDTTVAGVHDLVGSVEGTGVPARARVVVVPEEDVASVHTVRLTTPVGTAPTLPTLVTATTQEGREIELPVTWDEVDPHVYDTEGEFTVNGSVTGSSLPAKALITVSDEVEPVATAEVVQVRTQVGQRPVLPQDVAVTFEDGTQGRAPVQWGAISGQQYEAAGYFTVDGSVPGLRGVVRAFVTVAEVLNPVASADAACWTPGGNGTWTTKDGHLAHAGNTVDQSSWALVCDPADSGHKALTLGDGIVEATLRLTDTYGNGGLWVRSGGTADDRNGYYLAVEQHTTKFVAGKQVAGTWGGANEWAYGETGIKGTQDRRLKVVADGTHLSFFVDDMTQPVLMKEDASFTSGTVGVRTWRSGAQVSSFTVRPLTTVVAASDVAVSTSVGAAPVLPGTLDALDSAGDVVATPVTWQEVDPALYASAGTFTVSGTASGLDVVAQVSVGEAPHGATVRVPVVMTDPGVAPQLPAVAQQVQPDGTTSEVGVDWPELDGADFAEAGAWVDVTGSTTADSQEVVAHVAVATYSDSFATTGVQGWRTFGGTWSTSGGALVAKRDATWGRGEKAVASAEVPGDLMYQATVRVTQGNQAGILFRVSSPGVGADTYRGYYAGVDTTSGHVILGKANNGWAPIKESGKVQGVVPNQPVVMRVVARGPQIQVFVGEMLTPVIDVRDTSYTEGGVGVRGWNSAYEVSDVMVTGVAQVVSVEEVATTVKGSAAPSLPGTVRVTYADGTTGELPVEWDLEDLDLTQPELVVTGRVTGTDLPASARVRVLGAKDITSTDTVWVNTTVGDAPVLPATVVATRVDGSTSEEAVTWDDIDPDRYNGEGSFVVTGHLTQHPGVSAHVLVHVAQEQPDPDRVVSIEAVTVTTQVGVAPLLPGLVTAVHQDGSLHQVPVTWAEIDPASYAEEGSFQVQGTVAGTDIAAVATVEVQPVPVDTGSLEVRAVVTGEAASTAPERILADVACTVEGVEVDLGDSSTVELRSDGWSARIDGIPLGASCSVVEQGEVGSFGEASRSSAPENGEVTITQSVSPGGDVPSEQLVVLTNTYDWAAGMTISQIVTAQTSEEADGHEVEYSLTCTTSDGRATDLGDKGSFRLGDTESVEIGADVVAVGARCSLQTRGDDARRTTFTVEPDRAVAQAANGRVDLVLGGDQVAISATTDLTTGGSGDEGGNGGGAGTNGSGSGDSGSSASADLATTGVDSTLLAMLMGSSTLLLVAGLALRQTRRRAVSARSDR